MVSHLTSSSFLTKAESKTAMATARQHNLIGTHINAVRLNASFGRGRINGKIKRKGARKVANRGGSQLRHFQLNWPSAPPSAPLLNPPAPQQQHQQQQQQSAGGSAASSPTPSHQQSAPPANGRGRGRGEHLLPQGHCDNWFLKLGDQSLRGSADTGRAHCKRRHRQWQRLRSKGLTSVPASAVGWC